MRIIAGEYKGRKLLTPKDRTIRPTADKVKGAVFNMLAGQTPGSAVLDLFAGTGNLGLEALSRGAGHCYFGDYAKDSLTVIRENIASCKAEERSTVLQGDFRKILAELRNPCDIIFLDPPYQTGLTETCFALIRRGGLLAEGGVIVAEHGAAEVLPETMAGYRKTKEKNYGIVVISMYS